MKIVVNKNIVTWKLGKELTSAGIAHNGMSLFPQTNELEINLVNEGQAATAQAVVDQHDGIDTKQQNYLSAETNAKNIPSWSTWSEADALSWIDSHISNTQIDAIGSLADAKVVMKDQSQVMRAMVRMMIALRNRNFPGITE